MVYPIYKIKESLIIVAQRYARPPESPWGIESTAPPFATYDLRWVSHFADEPW